MKKSACSGMPNKTKIIFQFIIREKFEISFPNFFLVNLFLQSQFHLEKPVLNEKSFSFSPEPENQLCVE